MPLLVSGWSSRSVWHCHSLKKMASAANLASANGSKVCHHIHHISISHKKKEYKTFKKSDVCYVEFNT